MLYVIIYYIRRFEPGWTYSPKVYKGLCLGGYSIAFLSIIILDAIGFSIKSVNDYAYYYIRGDWGFFPVVISIGLFLWSIHWKISSNKMINWIGGDFFSLSNSHAPLDARVPVHQIISVE